MFVWSTSHTTLLWSAPHTLNTYKHHIDSSHTDLYFLCHASLYSVMHLIVDCPSLTVLIRSSWCGVLMQCKLPEMAEFGKLQKQQQQPNNDKWIDNRSRHFSPRKISDKSLQVTYFSFNFSPMKWDLIGWLMEMSP